MARLVHRLTDDMAGVARAGLGLLFPPVCGHCRADLPDGQHDGLLLCADCRILLGPELGPGCPRCGAVAAADDGSPGRCEVCRDVPLRFDAAVPLGLYQDELRAAVLRMKRPAAAGLSVAMGKLLAERRRGQLADLSADLIVPIPMYWSRRLARGTNSPEGIAEGVGHVLGVPIRRRVLGRCRNTLPQAELSPSQRFRNVRGAFRVRRGRPAGLRVLLVDDVLTTGATCSEAAGMLKQAGAAMVAAAVIARSQGEYAT